MKISMNRIMAAIEEDNHTGFCVACGAERDGCEPDARNYECEVCGEMKVFGAEELFFMHPKEK